MMVFKIQKPLMALLIVLFLGATLTATASVSTKEFDPAFLEGVDIIVVDHFNGPGAGLLPIPYNVKPFLPAYERVKQLFKDQPWIQVKEAHSDGKPFLTEPNAVIFQFSSSTRVEEINGKQIRISALSLQIRKLSPGAFSLGPKLKKDFAIVVPIMPVTYTFVVPETAEALDKKIAMGVDYITGFIPSYFACAKNKDDCETIKPPSYRGK